MNSFVAEYRPTVQSDGHKEQGDKLHNQVTESASFQVNHTCYLYEVLQRIGNGYGLCPFGHTVDGSKQPAHQHDDNHKENMTNMACCMVWE